MRNLWTFLTGQLTLTQKVCHHCPSRGVTEALKQQLHITVYDLTKENKRSYALIYHPVFAVTPGKAIILHKIQ